MFFKSIALVASTLVLSTTSLNINAAVVSYNGDDYNVTVTAASTYTDIASLLESQIWWSDSSAAIFFSDQVGAQLGIVNFVKYGPMFGIQDPSLDNVDAYSYNFDTLNTSGWGLAASSEVSWAVATVVPIPAALWLFSSGLIGLIGLARRKA